MYTQQKPQFAPDSGSKLCICIFTGAGTGQPPARSSSKPGHSPCCERFPFIYERLSYIGNRSHSNVAQYYFNVAQRLLKLNVHLQMSGSPFLYPILLDSTRFYSIFTPILLDFTLFLLNIPLQMSGSLVASTRCHPLLTMSRAIGSSIFTAAQCDFDWLSAVFRLFVD